MNNAKEERVTDLSIVMEMIDGKPYYSVQYRNVGENGFNQKRNRSKNGRM